MFINFEQIQTDLSEIRQQVQSLYERLHELVATVTPINGGVTISQADTLLGLQKATVCERRIPFHRPQGTLRLYFMRSELPKWLQIGRKRTINELDERTRQLKANRVNRRTVSNKQKGGLINHE